VWRWKNEDGFSEKLTQLRAKFSSNLLLGLGMRFCLVFSEDPVSLRFMKRLVVRSSTPITVVLQQTGMHGEPSRWSAEGACDVPYSESLSRKAASSGSSIASPLIPELEYFNNDP
jgi:hypothetical protein